LVKQIENKIFVQNQSYLQIYFYLFQVILRSLGINYKSFLSTSNFTLYWQTKKKHFFSLFIEANLNQPQIWIELQGNKVQWWVFRWIFENRNRMKMHYYISKVLWKKMIWKKIKISVILCMKVWTSFVDVLVEEFKIQNGHRVKGEFKKTF